MIDAKEQVIVVDQHDRAIGKNGKLDVHYDGQLHRAFSVFAFNSAGEMLLQKRAMTKYHSPGLWANTCCGHPRPGEPTIEAATRRTHEELNFTPSLSPAFQTIYLADVGAGLIEHEYVHVFGCHLPSLPRPDPAEASHVKFESIDSIIEDIQRKPEHYAAWFVIYVSKHIKQIEALSARHTRPTDT